MATIVILGGGLGGVMMAYEMRKKARKQDRIVLVSDRANFQFTPSNPWVAVGWRKPEQIEVALEVPLGKKKIEFNASGALRVRRERPRSRRRNDACV